MKTLIFSILIVAFSYASIEVIVKSIKVQQDYNNQLANKIAMLKK